MSNVGRYLGSNPRAPDALVWAVLLLVTAWLIWFGWGASGPAPCNETPRAFNEGVVTEYSDSLFSSSCSVTAAGGATVEKTIVNWPWIVAAIALIVGAYMVGRVATGRMDWRTGAVGVSLVSLVILIAVAASFT